MADLIAPLESYKAIAVFPIDKLPSSDDFFISLNIALRAVPADEPFKPALANTASIEAVSTMD